MRRIAVLALLIIACIVGVTIAASHLFANAPKKSMASVNPINLVRPGVQKQKRFIDGAVNPQLIPDKRAYLMLFRLLSNRHTEAEEKSVRAYITAMELGDANALLAVANDFENRVGELDRQAQQIHEQYGANLNAQALAQLNELQQRKERIVDEIIASLPDRLGADGARKCEQHITERVKRKMKYSE